MCKHLQVIFWVLAKDHDLAPAAAKKRRIILYTPHHAKAALTVCKAAIEMEEECQEEGKSWAEGYVFEDEKSWRGTHPDNMKLWVPKEDVAVSNIQQDNNRHGVFHLYQAIYKGGVVASHIYTEAYNEKFYAEVLLPKLAAGLKRVKEEEGFVPNVVHHDNCLNGKKNRAALNKHIGEGKWTTYTGKPCRKVVGHKKVKCFYRSGPKKGRLRCEQNRPIFEPCDPCECDFVYETTRQTATQAPANCPHLNLQELAFNQQLQIVQKNTEMALFLGALAQI